MSFFKPFKSKSAHRDGAPLPPPVTQERDDNLLKTRLQNLNPFRSQNIYLQDEENYVTPEPGFLELSRWDRMLIFGLTFAGSVSCYLICIFLFPVLLLKPRKFALLWSLGSIFFLVSFGVLQGFQAYMLHLMSSTRIPFTITFVTSIIMTLVSSLSLKSTLLSIVFAIIQLISAIWYTVSYFPMGQQTLNLASGVARSQVETWINS
ncbi:SFT2-domain-containing protein [Metschnikowia bicuspidata var. bicuspidata NRRL YB-4993]|uniref:Protein transport protein SFT2 n=1 Tax=Metschnikowia bicuspidata var. bicuspidata NRRL YB-4993 TaxID=869754 RepID=A0A1A0HCV3_9ASCO|nr:SFT2-domain-containing protein [Metschnikowia bicuspidata var. bicuspidata NRRL YB-4993]OBA21836.1 SFT2-domain-containing protein [Metschnikowia bicuspidata var. bicuspidata NRRL YB-4993]